MEVLAVDIVIEDSLFKNQNNTYGLIGLKAQSPFWDLFTDPVTGIAESSVALARTQTYWNTTDSALSAGSTQSNITLGTTDN